MSDVDSVAVTHNATTGAATLAGSLAGRLLPEVRTLELLVTVSIFVEMHVRNNHVMNMFLCHGGVLIEHECVCESRRVRVRRVGACHTIVESGRKREFVPPQPLVVWG
jgi:hypothetical protein